MQRFEPILAIALLIVSVPSCTEVFEEDLEGTGVVLLTPPASHSTPLNQLSFRWEAVEHATVYRFQVATPTFVDATSYLADTLLTGTTWTQTFTPGQYEWRVRAENSNSHTAYYTRSFTIESTEDLTGLVPLLISPSDGAVTSSSSVVFRWDTLPFMEDHRFVLREEDQFGGIVQDIVTVDDQLTLSALGEGDFAWGVQARNSVPSASAFAYRSITIDATAPAPPVQTSPASGATLPDGTFQFLWQSGQDALTSTSDSLIVRNGQAQIIRALGGLSGVHADSLGTGTYTWTVKTVDEAGNAAQAGPIAFTVP